MGLPAFQEPITNKNKIKVGGFIDTETTGLSPNEHEIIELAIVLFAYETKTGEILGIMDEYSSLREPSIKISKSATKVNGITIEMVKGNTLDHKQIEHMIASADILLAHNARFDIGFLVKLFPSILEKPWYCSMNGVKWVNHGFKNKKLHDLITSHGINIENAHRALDDVKAGIELLSFQSPDKEFYLKEIIRRRKLSIDSDKYLRSEKNKEEKQSIKIKHISNSEDNITKESTESINFKKHTKKPFYKKKWFWIVALLLFFYILGKTSS